MCVSLCGSSLLLRIPALSAAQHRTPGKTSSGTHVVALNPDDFVSRVSGLSDPELALYWRRAIFRQHIKGTSPELVAAAIQALRHWSEASFEGTASLQMQGIQGAIVTVARCIHDTDDRSYKVARELGLLFHSQNIGVAFAAIREFEVGIPSPLAMFVIDHLISVASSVDVPTSPNAMSLRGISFKVLFDLDSNFAFIPELQASLHECIVGCRAWAADGRSVYGKTLEKISKYRIDIK